MTILKIKTAGDPALKKKASPVEKINEEVINLAKNMSDTMKAAGGLGLAANQVGVTLRIIVIDFGYLDYDDALERGEDPDPPLFKPVVMINPEINTKEGVTSIQEGCLSVPGYRAEVDRALEISYTYTSIDGKFITATAKNLAAIAIQHELDHINGVLFIDRISNLKRNIALKKVRKYLENIQDNGDIIENTLYGKP